MKIRRLLIIIIAGVVPSIVSAHEGHGDATISGTSLLHQLVELEHLIPLLVIIAVSIFAFVSAKQLVSRKK
ncbi:MAG: hypothetical protein Q8P90_04610 [bacterium]|nr:hypothetical protein [bacterium]